MNHGRRYIFGPVPSRRLGRSLGVDVIPHKLCNFDCVYCEVGPTDKRAMRRQEYCPADKIIAELAEVLAEPQQIDTITFSGAGEPTLNSKLGTIIHAVKQLTSVPVAVITNGSLLYLENVRNDLKEADIVLPSLDAVSTRVFGMVNRPHPALQIETIIEGLKTFRKEFHGQIWLEILFVKGLNDERSEVERLRRVVREIQPDKVQLNTIIRPPSHAVFGPVAEKELYRLRELFGETCEVIGVSSARPVSAQHRINNDEILAALHRRAMTLDELAQALGLSHLDVLISLGIMEEEGLIESFFYYDRKHYKAIEEPDGDLVRKMEFKIHLN